MCMYQPKENRVMHCKRVLTEIPKNRKIKVVKAGPLELITRCGSLRGEAPRVHTEVGGGEDGPTHR